MGEKIETLHLEGKQGLSIDTTRYETICEAVLGCLAGGELTHAQLTCVEQITSVMFLGSIAWHVEVVKHDLEA